MEPVFIIRTAGIKKRWEVKEKMAAASIQKQLVALGLKN